MAAESDEDTVRTVDRFALPQEEEQRMQDDPPARPYIVGKLQKEAKRHWDLFYKRNTTNFFKDRRWITREFPALRRAHGIDGEKRPSMLEIGCGVGNTVFPLREENPALFVYACDLSPRAVDMVKANEAYSEADVSAFQCDLTKDDIAAHMPASACDLATAFFVLSALGPSEWDAAVRNIAKALKPGGQLCFRDYAVNDHAMVRFKKGHKLADRFYMRQDGTRAYYFELEETRELFARNGFEVESLEYVQRRTVNHKSGMDVPRIFLQGALVLKAAA